VVVASRFPRKSPDPIALAAGREMGDIAHLREFWCSNSGFFAGESVQKGDQVRYLI